MSVYMWPATRFDGILAHYFEKYFNRFESLTQDFTSTVPSCNMTAGKIYGKSGKGWIYLIIISCIIL